MTPRPSFYLFSTRFPALLFLLLAFLIGAAGFSPSFVHAGSSSLPGKDKDQPKQVAGSSRGASATAELDAVADSAEEIFQLAAAGKTERIGKRLDTLKKNVASLSYLQGQANNILLPRLGRTVADLEQAWSTKDRLDIMRFANRITLIAATLEVPLKTSVPTEVALLDYNCRELAIWSEANKTDKLSSIVMRMHLAWQTLMPKLIEHDGIRELRRFSEIMGRLEVARTPEDYGRLTRQVSPEIDTMRALFVKPAK